ncbi:MAG: triose-phosphate isomerase [Alphaproteobacteria bacterium]|nr:triose-phosphate isomerase [Alphaproteobacteria bacterium]
MHVRRKLVAGNWKMNGSLEGLHEVIAIADSAREAAGVDVAICPPFTLIAPAAMRGAGALRIGAQDVHHRPSGAHTGCVSAAMLKEAGATLAIAGHSERRGDQRETDEEVRAKAEAGLGAGIDMIICVGESHAQRQAGDQVAVVQRQLAASLPDDPSGAEMIVAYEPIWAIGTGNVATPDDVAEMHAAIRNALVARYGDAGNHVRILYGGSVKAENAKELFAVADVDGALVGGASLTAAQFVPIIEAASRS